jgi:hypothetical protein
VTSAIRGLPDRQRSAFVLAVFEGRSHHQIATRLGTSVAGSKALVLRARLALARDAARRGVLALAEPFAKLGNVAGEHTPVAWVAVAAVAASPALLVGGGRIVSEQVLRPGDPSPRSSHVGAPKGSPLPPGRTYVEAKVALDAGAQPAGRRYLRLTCPPGLVFAGGMSAGGGGAAPALRSSGLSRWQHRAGRYRSAQIQFLTRRRLARDYVATFGIMCMTREGYRAKRRRDRRFMCGVWRQLIREHPQRGEPIPRPIGEAMAGDCGG